MLLSWSYRCKLQVLLTFILVALLLVVGTYPAEAYYIRLAYGDPLVYLPFEAVWVGLTLFVPIDLVGVFDGIELETLPDNSRVITLNGKSKVFSAGGTDSIIEGDTFFVSLSALVTFLGLRMEWDAESATVHLTPIRSLTGGAGPSLSDEFLGSTDSISQEAEDQDNLSEQEAKELEAFLIFSQDIADEDLLETDQSVIIIEEEEPVIETPIEVPVKAEYLIEAEKANWVKVIWSQTEDGRERISIKGSKDFTITTFLLTDPKRLVVDLAGLYTGHAEPLSVNSEMITNLRLQQNQEDVVRLVIELNKMVGYQISEDEEYTFHITMNYALSEINATFDEMECSLSLNIPASASFRQLRLSDPERIVIDLDYTTLIIDELVLPGGGPVHQVRVSQHDPLTTRIVLDIKSGFEILPVKVDNKLTFLGAKHLEGIGYAQLSSGSMFLQLVGENLPEPEMLYFSRSGGPVLVIDLPGVALSKQLANIQLPQGLGWAIRSAQHSDKVRVVVDLRLAVDYVVIPLEPGQGVGIFLLIPDLSGKSIFVDPGHGGAIAPGAKGAFLEEKEVNLSTALYLKQILNRSGAEAIFSREDDTYVSLTDRLELSKIFGADLFLSIHANSATNTKATGIETWMHNRLRAAGSTSLAQAMQKALVDMLGLVDRGVKQKSLAVLGSSDIPRVLLEIGFLSNLEEEELLKEDWFRRLSAQGIFNGLVAFYDLTDQRKPAEVSPEIKKEATLAITEGSIVYLPDKSEENFVVEQTWDYLVLNEEYFQD